MSTYEVKKYEPHQQAHYLVEEDDDEEDWIYVDLLVAGEITVDNPKDLVGKKVEIEKLKPYLMIANDIEVI